MFRSFTRMPDDEIGVQLNTLKPGRLFVFHTNTSESQVYMVVDIPGNSEGRAVVSLIGGKVVITKESTLVHPVEASINWKLVY